MVERLRKAASCRASGPTDCHFHTYDRRYPAVAGSALLPEDASPDDYRALQRRLGTTRSVIIPPSTYAPTTDCKSPLGRRSAPRTFVLWLSWPRTSPMPNCGG